MNKKRNKTLSVALAFVIALAMSLGGITSVFADPVAQSTGTPGSPAQAAITKILAMPVNTPTPSATFTFNIDAKNVDGVTATDASAPTNMPAIGDVSINIGSTDTGTVSTSGIVSIPKQSGDIFSGVTFPHSGIYVYEVTEQNSGYSAGSGETMNYSLAKYELTAFVAETTTGSGIYYIKAITSEIITPDNPGQTVDTKVDPTPGTGGSGTYSGMTFTNNYYKTGGGVNPGTDTDVPLLVSKAAIGDLADTSYYFPFQVTVTQPAVVTGSTTYQGYIVNSAGTVVTHSSNGAIAGSDGSGSYINFVSGVTTPVKLKHGQKLALMGLHIGTQYRINELGTDLYTPSVEYVVNGGTPLPAAASNHGDPLAIGPLFTGPNTNKAAYTNTRADISPTGINLNDLPYYVLILLAAAALAAYAVVRSRRRRARG
jgi:hypothetical protein